MKKGILAVTSILVALSATRPAAALVRPTDPTSGQNEAEALLENVIYKGTPVKVTDAIAKATYQLELFHPTYPMINLPSCTATLIDNDVLLTAAHCLKGDEIGYSIKYYSFASKSYKKMKVALVKMHEGYTFHQEENKGDVVTHDIALLRTEKAIPNGVTALLPKRDFSLGSSRNVIQAGYGENGRQISKEELLKNPEVQALIKYAQENPNMTEEQGLQLVGKLVSLSAEKPLLSNFAKAWMDNDAAARQGPALELSSSNAICSGDSGGPTYLRQTSNYGRLTVIGVHSTGTGPDCAPRPGIIFKKNFLSHDTFVPDYIDWIEKNVRALKAQEI